MKSASFFVPPVASLLLALVPVSLLAQGAETAAADDTAGKSGYTVTVAIKVDEKGETEDVVLVDTDDESAGDYLTKIAIAMAVKTDLPPREKDGKPIKYTVRAPFFFPIDDDEGAAANHLPIPRPKKETAYMPAYPVALRDEGVTGGVVLELFVDATGKLTDLKTLRASHPEFEAAATEAIRKWTFAAPLKDGKAVASRARLAIAFETEEKMAEMTWRVPPRPALGTFVVIRPSAPIQEIDRDEEAAVPTAETTK